MTRHCWCIVLSVCCRLAATTTTVAFVPPARPASGRKRSSQAPLGAFLANDGSKRRQQRRRRPKTVRDRTPQEAQSLIQDVIKAALEAGPRAGPRRTWQAYQAILRTSQEFVPQMLSSNPPALPRVLRTLFERLGATYIKLGQFIASSPTIFPAEYVREFQKCLDQTEPVPWDELRPVVERELGAPLSRLFSNVDTTPLASASIAQVHAARLRSGEDVVLKIQKPGIEDCLQADLGFIFVAARVLEFLSPNWERTSLAAIAGDLRQSMLEELDFTKEAHNTIEFGKFLREHKLTSQATAPKVYLDTSTKKVLTLERLDGVSLLDETAISQITRDPQVGTDTILTALNIWSLSVTSMPFFHADVHAGNLMLLRDGRVAFIDFGIVGRIGPKVFVAVNELSTALAGNDATGMAQALCNMGAADDAVDVPAFGRDLERLLERMNTMEPPTYTISELDSGNLQTTMDMDNSAITNLLLDLVDITENYGLKLPREFGLLVKQSLYFDRYLKILAPSVDVLTDDRVMLGGTSWNELDGGDANGADPNPSSDSKAVIDV